jgi:hypothetical protein
MLLEEIPKLAQRSLQSLPKNPKDVSCSVILCAFRDFPGGT